MSAPDMSAPDMGAPDVLKRTARRALKQDAAKMTTLDLLSKLNVLCRDARRERNGRLQPEGLLDDLRSGSHVRSSECDGGT